MHVSKILDWFGDDFDAGSIGTTLDSGSAVSTRSARSVSEPSRSRRTPSSGRASWPFTTRPRGRRGGSCTAPQTCSHSGIAAKAFT